MLFLLFQLGRDRYALDIADVAQVLPLVQIKTIPQAPLGVAGAFNYHGAPVPVVDLSALAIGRPAQARLSTRVILVHYAAQPGEKHLLGLIAENATEMLRRDPADFVSSGVRAESAPYLGPVASDARGLVQRITPARLLSPEVRDVLFRQPVES